MRDTDQTSATAEIGQEHDREDDRAPAPSEDQQYFNESQRMGLKSLGRLLRSRRKQD